ncbi:hypothetical protein [Paraburkholderia caballeronis]|uniref:Uncharacterized protein n=1 Tax=Paraburkholderia caballeronis TaxID=416943 RepID=A0A1H7VZR1_9BURK|nr:hypothetical protein [Paraburkholderia caballeronis]PXW22759.1 hypothetical protein C7403_113154 [Paraburkholderia caballeronis]PXW96862.1 hypothetical protein C7407_113154 [Paraburkholderia caballeronis]RAJ93489.1 hypothetical protein C7409_113154 [Paraburkholderia caballeronis]TDV12212.1 hypothetical protein C7408_110153 [Paraburkholderia caballeronis]TDV15287.1 hypothetical protein C7406_111153 [Paraburkholderia caballeronis]
MSDLQMVTVFAMTQALLLAAAWIAHCHSLSKLGELEVVARAHRPGGGQRRR